MNTTFAFLPNLGMTELLVLAFLGLLIFGKKLPEVGKSLAQGIVSFKKGLQGVESHIEGAMNEEPVMKKKKKKKAIVADAQMTGTTDQAQPQSVPTVEKVAE